MFFFQWANQIGSLWGGKKKGWTCEALTFIFSGWKIFMTIKCLPNTLNFVLERAFRGGEVYARVVYSTI
jgi:hypothetical protein